MVLWGMVDPADGGVALGEAWSWGPFGSGLFICKWQASNSIKPKRTFIGTWLQAWPGPEAEFRQNLVSPFHSAVLCAGFTLGQTLLAWWPPIRLYVHLSSPIFFLPTISAIIRSQTLIGFCWITCPSLNQLL